MSWGPQEDVSAVRLWDTGKSYAEKRPLARAFEDKANWAQVPYGTADYAPRGDLMLENDHSYVFLFTSKEDSISLAGKLEGGRVKDNEIYKVHDTGRRNFGHGTMAVKVLENRPEEIVIEHAGEGRRHGTPQTVMTTYRLLAGEAKDGQTVAAESGDASPPLGPFLVHRLSSPPKVCQQVVGRLSGRGVRLGLDLRVGDDHRLPPVGRVAREAQEALHRVGIDPAPGGIAVEARVDRVRHDEGVDACVDLLLIPIYRRPFCWLAEGSLRSVWRDIRDDFAGWLRAEQRLEVAKTTG